MGTQAAGSYILSSIIGSDSQQDRLISGAADLLAYLNDLPDAQLSWDDIKETHLIPFEKSYSPSVPCASEYFKGIKKGTTQGLGQGVSFEVPNYGSFVSDAVVYVKFAAIGEVTPNLTGDDADDETRRLAQRITQNIKYRYTDYPGIALFKKVQLISGGAPFESYSRDDMLLHTQHHVPPSIRTAWTRSLGMADVQQVTSYHRRAEILEYKSVRLSAQCPRAYQPPLEMWIPLILFMRESNPLPTGELLQGSSEIRIDLAPTSDIIQAIDIKATSPNDVLNIGGAQLVPSALFNIPPESQPVNLTVSAIELYTNNLFVPVSVMTAYANTRPLTLIRIHKEVTQPFNLDNPTGILTLPGLKYPVETISFGFRRKANIGDFEKWHRFTKAYSRTFRLISSERATTSVSYATNPPTINDAGVNADLIIAINHHIIDEDPLIDNFSFTVGEQRLFNRISPSFFGQYAGIPMVTNGGTVSIAEDHGAYLMSFAHALGGYQPSGYINTSTEKEIRMEYESSVIGPSNKVELVYSMRLIAFLSTDNAIAHLTFIT